MSERVFKAYIDGGADILEIGYPFSDPIADGPVNQRAAQRAITAGLNHSRFFSMVKKLRLCTDIPFGILLYANTVQHLGYDLFCKKAADAGIDSILVADMPPEESHEIYKSMRACGLGRVFIISELTPESRIKFICDQVDSFVYVVSRLGTTGTGKDFGGSVESTINKIKSVSDKPLAVGFGISSPDHVRAVKRSGADGAIVGSALVSIIESNINKAGDLPAILRKKVSSFKAATRF